jgi:predicted RNA binding protein YcfA (HicA-like mRNA interferase family)
MPKLRALTGRDLLGIFAAFGFEPASQRGSHVKLRRLLPGGVRQTLTIVLHDEVDKGTLRAIFRQAVRYVPESELRPHFFTED